MDVTIGKYLGQFAFCVSHNIYTNFVLDILSGNGMGQIRLLIVRTEYTARSQGLKFRGSSALGSEIA